MPRQLGDPDGAPAGLADRLRARTRTLHVEAERAGIVADLLQGRADRAGYALLLRNLLPAYRELETGLERYRERPGFGGLAQRAVYRAAALESDLRALCGDEWEREAPLLEAGERYARRVADAAAGDGARLLGHAYVRFLGDLNGGRVLRRLIGRSLGLAPDALAFYAYPGVADLEALRDGYRRALDQAGCCVDADAVADEAIAAFRHNIEISEAVRRAATPWPPVASAR